MGDRVLGHDLVLYQCDNAVNVLGHDIVGAQDFLSDFRVGDAAEQDVLDHGLGVVK